MREMTRSTNELKLRANRGGQVEESRFVSHKLLDGQRVVYVLLHTHHSSLWFIDRRDRTVGDTDLIVGGKSGIAPPASTLNTLSTNNTRTIPSNKCSILGRSYFCHMLASSKSLFSISQEKIKTPPQKNSNPPPYSA